MTLVSGAHPLADDERRTVYELHLELHLRDDAVDALDLETAGPADVAPVGDDLVHRLLLALLLVALVVVLAQDQPDLEVQHDGPEARHQVHTEDEVDVLHSTQRVATRREVTRAGVHGGQPDQHRRVAGVVIRPPQLGGVVVEPRVEGGPHDADVLIRHRRQHSRQLVDRDMGLDRSGEHEPEGTTRPVADPHGLQPRVERVGPGVTGVELDELETRVTDVTQPGRGRTLVLARVDHHDDAADPRLEVLTDPLGDVLVVVGPDDDRDRGQHVLHEALPFPVKGIG